MFRLTLSWLLSVCALCATPVPLPDSILTTTTSGVTAGAARSSVLLRADGTYVGLRTDVRVSTMPSSVTEPPDTGTYAVAASLDAPEEFTVTFTNRSGIVTVTPGRFTSDHTGQFTSRTPWNWGTSSFIVSPRSEILGACNVSNRSPLAAGSALITGFIVSGSGARWVLIRAAGPALRRFDVPNAAALATLDVYSGATPVAHADAWGAEPRLVQGIKALTEAAGAFAFDEGSTDSALMLHLPAGAYTVHVRTGAGSGEVLGEVYLLPYSG